MSLNRITKALTYHS